RIRRIDSKGVITTVAGTGIQGHLGGDGAATSAQIDFVSGLEIDSLGNVYIAEPLYIRRLTRDVRLQVVSTYSGILTSSGIMTRDASGNFWIFGGQGGEDIYRISPDGTLRLVLGYASTGASIYRRLQTIGAQTDAAGNVYALQEDLNRPRQFKIYR